VFTVQSAVQQNKLRTMYIKAYTCLRNHDNASCIIKYRIGPK